MNEKVVLWDLSGEVPRACVGTALSRILCTTGSIVKRRLSMEYANQDRFSAYDPPPNNRVGHLSLAQLALFF